MRHKNHLPRSAFGLLNGRFLTAKVTGICALFACSMLPAMADLRSDYQDQQDREVVCNKLWSEGQFEEVAGKSRYIVDYKLAIFTEISIRNTGRVGKDLIFMTYCEVGSPIRLNRETWPVKDFFASGIRFVQIDQLGQLSTSQQTLPDPALKGLPSRRVTAPKAAGGKTLFVIEGRDLVKYSKENVPGSFDSRVSRVVIAVKRKG